MFSVDVAELNETVLVDYEASGVDRCELRTSESGGPIVRGTGVAAVIGLTATVECWGDSGNVTVTEPLPVRAARLSWLAPQFTIAGAPIEGLAGFRLYHGPRSESRSEVITIDDPSDTDVTFRFPSGPRYFQVTAVDVNGNESDYSNEVYKNVP